MIIKDGIVYEVQETEINVEILETEKSILEQSITDLPEFKVKADKECLDLYNSFVQVKIDGLKNVQARIDDIDTKLNEIIILKDTIEVVK